MQHCVGLVCRSVFLIANLREAQSKRDSTAQYAYETCLHIYDPHGDEHKCNKKERDGALVALGVLQRLSAHPQHSAIQTLNARLLLCDCDRLPVHGGC